MQLSESSAGRTLWLWRVQCFFRPGFISILPQRPQLIQPLPCHVQLVGYSCKVKHCCSTRSHLCKRHRLDGLRLLRGARGSRLRSSLILLARQGGLQQRSSPNQVQVAPYRCGECWQKVLFRLGFISIREYIS